MSLNIAPEGLAYNSAPVTDVTTVTMQTFDTGDGNDSQEFLLSVDTADADVDLKNLPTPAALGLDNVSLTVVKANKGTGTIRYIDPRTQIEFAYVDRQGESITLAADNGKWIVRP